MVVTISELAKAYVARTEKAETPYFQQLVTRLEARLKGLGYTDHSDPEKLRSIMRSTLEEEQEKTRKAAHGRAEEFSKEDAEDLVQDAWVDALEASRLKRPKGHFGRWTGKVRQMESPIHYPLGTINSGDWEMPDKVQWDDSVEYTDLAALDPEVCLDLREAFETLTVEHRRTLEDLVMKEEPILDYARRNGLSLADAETRRDSAIAALREAFNGSGE